MITRDKVRGMYLGTAIGDALGMPVETWTPDRIRKAFPNGIRGYEKPSSDHKWFKDKPAGTWTDDTLLTLATSRGLVEAGNFDLDALARAQVWALEEALKQVPEGQEVGGSGVPGWGNTTADAIRRLANNVPWTESGKTRDPNSGYGNGVVMKVAPLAAWFLSPKNRRASKSFNRAIVDFSAMTHYTKQSAIAAVVHVHAVIECLNQSPETYNPEDDLLEPICDCAASVDRLTSHLNDPSKDMLLELVMVDELKGESLEEIARLFNGGSCNVASSLPFTYSYWIRYYDSVQLLFSLAEAGGDTDSNASIAGGMLGALHGTKVFPQYLIETLDRASDILKAADEFCDTFGVEG